MSQTEAITEVQDRYTTTGEAARAAVYSCQELGSYQFAADGAILNCTYSNGQSSTFAWA
jgi:hypothetical protein